jgi:GT2 family glycosyltransferase
MPNDNNTTKLTISISTKDRPDILESTLRNIIAFGLADYPLLICDDGSNPPLQPKALSLFKYHQLIRHEIPMGFVYSRNRLIEMCDTKYLLQLDDDSYPVEGSIAELLDVAEQAKNWIALAIPFDEPARARCFPTGIPRYSPIIIRSFVGCSVLINVAEFKLIGGYSEWLGGYGEEDEASLRGLAKNKNVLSVDGFRIRHEVSDINRNIKNITRRSFKNNTLVRLLRTPIILIPWMFFRLVIGSFMLCFRQGNTSALQGVILGLKCFPSLARHRSPIPVNCYNAFRKLPHALDFFN